MSAALKIFVTADPELPVPPRLYGGIERIVDLLVSGLIGRGHDVTLFAHPESNVRCRLVSYRTSKSRGIARTCMNAGRIAREALAHHPDVVQSFGRLAYLAPLFLSSVPKVMSYQREVTARGVRWSSRLASGRLYFTGCSHRQIHDVQRLGRWRVIYNAVPLETYRFSESVAPSAPLVFLGRIEHIKGTHVAIEVARRSGRPLVIAGNVPSEHRPYFDSRVKPHVDGRAVTYVGPVEDVAKAELLASAAALLMPVLWDEPFGIVMAEALACGTPVIGLARGAVPEVIEDRKTGFVCPDEDSMVAAVTRLSSIDRAACRNAAERRFSQTALVDAYESLYAEVTTSHATRRATASRSAPGAARSGQQGVEQVRSR